MRDQTTLRQPACHDEMTWLSGRTLQTADHEGMIRCFGPGRVENLGSLYLIKEGIDPNGTEGFGHVKENGSC